jgi:hypothetical protein
MSSVMETLLTRSGNNSMHKILVLILFCSDHNEKRRKCNPGPAAIKKDLMRKVTRKISKLAVEAEMNTGKKFLFVKM